MKSKEELIQEFKIPLVSSPSPLHVTFSPDDPKLHSWVKVSLLLDQFKFSFFHRSCQDEVSSSARPFAAGSQSQHGLQDVEGDAAGAEEVEKTEAEAGREQPVLRRLDQGEEEQAAEVISISINKSSFNCYLNTRLCVQVSCHGQEGRRGERRRGRAGGNISAAVVQEEGEE